MMEEAMEKCVCPEISFGMLPMLIHNAALKGNNEKVLKWLEDGGDVNATDMNGRTLVFMACELNHSHLLRDLLKIPEIHINQATVGPTNDRVQGMTPLSISMDRNHVECVEALLSSPTKCKIDLVNLSMALKDSLKAAACQRRWKVVEILLRAGITLKNDESAFIFNTAARFKAENVIKMMVDGGETNLDFRHINSSILNILYENDMWNTSGARKVLKQYIDGRCYYAFKVLQLAMNRKDFSMIEDAMKLFIPNVEIKTSLAEAVLGRELVNIEKCLTPENLNEGAIYGALCVAAIGGTTEEVAEKLFSLKESYPKDCLKYILMLASLFGQIELIPMLLKHGSFDYSTLSRALDLGCDSSEKDTGMMLVHRALKLKADETIPMKNGEDELLIPIE